MIIHIKPDINIYMYIYANIKMYVKYAKYTIQIYKYTIYTQMHILGYNLTIF